MTFNRLRLPKSLVENKTWSRDQVYTFASQIVEKWGEGWKLLSDELRSQAVRAYVCDHLVRMRDEFRIEPQEIARFARDLERQLGIDPDNT